ncbi:hypothetical protein A0U40_17800 [[Bacillus] sp. KCTC 13219]|nr:hypothetical protein A0U40_17800 [[Bacillus] sp. KCTC 13219]
MQYEQLAIEVYQNKIEIYEEYMTPSFKGLYSDNIIWLNKLIRTHTEKTCVLAEEFGHYHTTDGNILDQSNISARKQELNARRWAYNKLVPLSKIVQAHKLHLRNRYELADFLNVTEDFLKDALEWYKSKHGLYVSMGNYTICFEPLGVLELFECANTNLIYGT